MIDTAKTRILVTALTGCVLGVFASAPAAWQQPPQNRYYPAPVAPYPYYAYQRPMVPPGYYYAPYAYPSQPRPPHSNRPMRTPPASKPAPEARKAPVQKKPSTQAVQQRKQKFVDKLLPYIERQNAAIKQTRAQLLKLVQRLNAGYQIDAQQQSWLNTLTRRYRIKENPLHSESARKELLVKVDIIPASLTLAQAANESAWGKSRFALQANNLFGIWTYDEDKGLKPMNRDSEKKHLVRKFEHVGESIKFYMLMLNSHPAYHKLRSIRAQSRREQRTPSGARMAAGLEKYSAKGNRYIELIKQLIRQNQWARLDEVKSG